MKILLWAPLGSGKHYWGPGMSAYNLYSSDNKLLNKYDVELYLAHGYKDQKDYSLFEKQFFISEVTTKNYITYLKFFFNSHSWIKKNVHNFDVVHALSAFHHSFLPAYWFSEFKIPSFVKITGSKAGFTSPSTLSKLLGAHNFRLRNKNKITGYISISSKITDELKSISVTQDKIYEIPNGVDTNRFKPADDQLAVRDKLNLSDKITVIFTGGFSRRKDPSMILRSMNKLTKSEKEKIHVILVGPDRDDGGERKRVQKYIRNHESSNISVLGFRENIEQFYQAADIFVLPSKNEGLSNSLLEAMACGCSVLSTPVSGSTDVIKHKMNGYLFNNSLELTKYLKKLINNEKKVNAQGKKSRQIIEKKYSSKKILRKHLNIFQAAINK